MGHYYGDLMCDDCGQLHCICIRIPSPPDLNWMVDKSDMSVITIDDYDKKHKNEFEDNYGSPIFMRLHESKFKNKKDAEVYLIDILQENLKEAKARVIEIEEMLLDRTATKLKEKK